jgi:hypothetical protein
MDIQRDCHNCAKTGAGGIGEAIGRWGKAAWGSAHLDQCPGPRGAQESAGVSGMQGNGQGRPGQASGGRGEARDFIEQG